ncbi:MAG: DUF3943 domain-containing protein [Chitinophagaceae bacterium]
MQKNNVFAFFLFLGILIPSAKSLSQDFTFLPGRFTDSDSIIIDQFIQENSPEKENHSGNSTFFNSSYSISLADKGTGSLKYNIAQQDSFLLRNQHASIWRKMGRAQIFIGGTELLCMGILLAMPVEVTKWQPGFLDAARKNLKRSFTTLPVHDEDGWGFNFVGHPIAGSFYYNSIRSQHATIFQSFVFSFAQSAFWEYVIEGMAEKPSVQDLIVTPIFGTLLGEASHLATISMRRNGFNWLEKITVIILNPFYVVNNGFRTTNKKR